jgi:hypothetical protein
VDWSQQTKSHLILFFSLSTFESSIFQLRLHSFYCLSFFVSAAIHASRSNCPPQLTDCVTRTRWHLARKPMGLSMKARNWNGWIKTEPDRRYAAPITMMLMISIGKVCSPRFSIGNCDYPLTTLEWGPYLSERQWVCSFSSPY